MSIGLIITLSILGYLIFSFLFAIAVGKFLHACSKLPYDKNDNEGLTK